MEIGYNKLNITPTQPVHIAGYNRKELSKGVLDPIEINSLVIKENNKTTTAVNRKHRRQNIHLTKKSFKKRSIHPFQKTI